MALAATSWAQVQATVGTGGGFAGGVATAVTGMAAPPTFWFAIPQVLDLGAAAAVTYTTAIVGNDVVITQSADANVAVVYDVVAMTMLDIADEVTALLNTAHRTDVTGATHTTLVANTLLGTQHATAMVKSATETCVIRNVPATLTATRESTLATGSIAGAGTYTRTLAQLVAAFPGMGFTTGITEFVSDNPLVTIAFTGGLIANGITCTNLDPNNAQEAVIRVREVHSIVQ